MVDWCKDRSSVGEDSGGQACAVLQPTSTNNVLTRPNVPPTVREEPLFTCKALQHSQDTSHIF